MEIQDGKYINLGVCDKTLANPSRYISEHDYKQFFIKKYCLEPRTFDVINIGLPPEFSYCDGLNDFILKRCRDGIDLLISNSSSMRLNDALKTGYYLQVMNDRTFDAITQAHEVEIRRIVIDSDMDTATLVNCIRKIYKSKHTKDKKIVFKPNVDTLIIHPDKAGYDKVYAIAASFHGVGAVKNSDSGFK